MKNFIILSFTFLALAANLHGQQFSFTGTVYDSTDNSPLLGADVILYKLPENAKPIGRAADKTGSFSFTNLAPAVYLLQVTYMGYNDMQDTIRLFRKSILNRKLFLSRSAVETVDIEITGKAIPAVQKGDTIQFINVLTMQNIVVTANSRLLCLCLAYPLQENIDIVVPL